MCYNLPVNTLQKGQVRYIVFRDKDTWYAAGMEFNIVESGDDPRIALLNLFDALEGYMESCRKVKGVRLAPLNQTADPEYEQIWKNITADKPVKSPLEINTFGVLQV
jgi:hypothetical protein